MMCVPCMWDYRTCGDPQTPVCQCSLLLLQYSSHKYWAVCYSHGPYGDHQGPDNLYKS